MSEDSKTIELEGVHPSWLLTPEGQRRAQEFFSRNADKPQLQFGPGDVPPGYVKLQQVYVDRIEDMFQQRGEPFAPPPEIVPENLKNSTLSRVGKLKV